MCPHTLLEYTARVLLAESVVKTNFSRNFPCLNVWQCDSLAKFQKPRYFLTLCSIIGLEVRGCFQNSMRTLLLHSVLHFLRIVSTFLLYIAACTLHAAQVTIRLYSYL